jgi:hypothetical protein
METDILKVDDE